MEPLADDALFPKSRVQPALDRVGTFYVTEESQTMRCADLKFTKSIDRYNRATDLDRAAATKAFDEIDHF